MRLTAYHRGIIGAVLHIRTAEADAVSVAGGLERLSQSGICTDAACERKNRRIILLRRAHRFTGQRLDNGMLE